jgi:hypothetical protein
VKANRGKNERRSQEKRKTLHTGPHCLEIIEILDRSIGVIVSGGKK